MRNIAAYLLAVLGGNASPDAAAVKKILSSVGVEGDDEKIKKLVSELHGKDLATIIAEGSSKLASLPSGGGGGAAAAPAAAAPAAGGAAPKAEEKKEEKKEESDEDMGLGLFD